MTALVLTTKAEQRLEYLQGLKRPLSEAESADLQRSMHAVYERDRRLELAAKIEAEWADAILNEHAEHERETLRKINEETEFVAPSDIVAPHSAGGAAKL